MIAENEFVEKYKSPTCDKTALVVKFSDMLTFQEIIKTLQNFWTERGCILQQSYDIETGAGTFNPETFLRCVGPEPYKVCNVEISKRPTDGRYGQNPNRLQKFHQFQVILKPSPRDFQTLYLKSLEALGLNLKDHDIRFVHDDWESPTQGAWGLGWEVWCDGMEITQFTYFQSVGGIELNPIVGELAYGLERLAMYLQNVKNVYDVKYNEELSYGDVFLQSEVESCHYNFEEADVAMWKRHFEDFEKEGKKLISLGRANTAYDFAIKASNAFNMLDARSAISTTARVGLMHRIRDLACLSAKSYLEAREKMGFPLLRGIEKEKEADLPVPKIRKPFFSRTKDHFLLEIGSEELPAAFIPGALTQLEKLTRSLLQEHNLSYGSIKVYGAPRRLAVHVVDLIKESPAQSLERKGPGLNIAFDELGVPTKQAIGFFKSVNEEPLTRQEIEIGKSSVVSIKEGSYLIAVIKKPSRPTAEILQESLAKLITDLPFPKKMRWGRSNILYARPIVSILSLFGKQLISFNLGEIHSNVYTYGHHQMAPGPIRITHPKKYLSKLKKAHVLACPYERKKHLDKELDRFSRKLNAQIVQRELVSSEVINLSEYPSIGSHTFDEKFLVLPKELLCSEMIVHQRYYPLADRNGVLLNRFLVAIDKEPTDLILKGNETVLSARLTDGLFLFEQDKNSSLDAFNESLKSIVFHKDLGSIFDKTVRIKELSLKIGDLLQERASTRAAELCKADLASAVVYEFPELQGVMGKYYALEQKESHEVATAIEEHYWPLSEGSRIPKTVQGSILSLADKFDNLISYTKVGIKASSSKDPYALRRSAIGALRILIEHKWSFDLKAIISDPELLAFILQRLKGVLAEYDFEKEEIDAVMTLNLCDPYDLYSRAKALHKFRASSDAFEKLHEIYKRAKGQIGKETPQTFRFELLKEAAEKRLFETFTEIEARVQKGVEQKDYLIAFDALASLKNPLSTFFDEVRVLADDPDLKTNRIALLQKIFHNVDSLLDFNQVNER